MKVSVVNMAGQEVSSVELPASIFEANVNVALMHQALVRQMANARRGTHKAQGRSEVNRTGKKIYRQKGTGNARHGSRRAPIYVGGGVAHGPRPRDYSKNMPRKMRRAALRSALTVKASEGGIVVLDALKMSSPKTKEVAELVQRLVGGSSTLIVLPQPDEVVEKSTRNLADVKALHAHYLNIRDLLGHDKLLLSVDALDVIVDILGLDERITSQSAEQVSDSDEAESVQNLPKDNLQLIEGIGPKIAEVLEAAGITTFAQLAATTVEELQTILEEKVRIFYPDTWPEQAALAAEGKMEELKALQDQLEGGRRVDEAEE